jgi:hypothetical protein
MVHVSCDVCKSCASEDSNGTAESKELLLGYKIVHLVYLVHNLLLSLQ